MDGTNGSGYTRRDGASVRFIHVLTTPEDELPDKRAVRAAQLAAAGENNRVQTVLGWRVRMTKGYIDCTTMAGVCCESRIT